LTPASCARGQAFDHLQHSLGDADAQSNLGVMYAQGQGVPKDIVLAYMWFNLAAAQGHANAVKNRDTAASKNDT